MQISPNQSTPYHRLDETSNNAGIKGEPQASDPLIIEGARNVPRRPELPNESALNKHHQTVRKISFLKAFSEAGSALNGFDENAREAFSKYPFQAMALLKKITEYDDAAQKVLTSLSKTEDSGNAPSQRDEVDQLIKAIHALVDSLPEWERHSASSSPTFRDFLNTVTGKRSAHSKVQDELIKFSIWIETRFNNLGNYQRGSTGI